MSTSPNAKNVVELRRYTLHPGHRDTLIDLFDSEFIETQEALGMTVLGQFRDDDHPDTFTWFRGFTDMTARQSALGAFYGGPCWTQHRDAANATMIDSDNVLLLAPVSGHIFPTAARAVGKSETPPRRIEVMTFHLASPATTDQSAALSQAIGPGRVVALLATLDTTNTFPALAVREGEHVIVAVTISGSLGSSTWVELGKSVFGEQLKSTEVLQLSPTTRSRLR